MYILKKTVQTMKQSGVSTLYLQIGTDSTPRRGGFTYPEKANKLIEYAHQHNMYVVGWYLPDFVNIKRDERRIMQGARHRTPRDHRIDGFALDIESTREPSRNTRNRRLLNLSRSLRARLGARYPLGAIVPDSTSTAPRQSLWPGFPYQAIANLYQAFLPMAYSNYRGEGARFVGRYSRKNIRHLRSRTGRRRLPIHFIGGESATISGAEARALVRIARQEKILGVSLYDYAGSRVSVLRALGKQ